MSGFFTSKRIKKNLVPVNGVGKNIFRYLQLSILALIIYGCGQTHHKQARTEKHQSELEQYLMSIDPVIASRLEKYLYNQQLFDWLEAAEVAGNTEKVVKYQAEIANNFRLSGHYHESIRFYRSALSQLADDPDRAAEIYHGLAAVYYELFIHDRGQRHYLDSASAIGNRAYEYAERAVSAVHLSDALNLLGAVNIHFGNYSEAIEQLQTSLDINRAMETDPNLAIMSNLSYAHYKTGSLETALQYAWEAFEEATQAGDMVFAANSLKILDKIYRAQGDTASAELMHNDLQRLVAQDDHMIRSLIMQQLHLNYERRQDEKIILGMSRESYYLIRLSRILLAGTLLLMLVTIAIFYMMRQRVKHQKAKIEQAKLQSKLAHEESQRHLLELRIKQQELTFYSLRQIAQSEFARMLVAKLTPFAQKFSRKSDQAAYNQLIQEIRREVKAGSLDELENMIKQMHSGFFEKLTELNPSLTRRELHFCALLRMNLSSKDISELLKIELSTVDRTRFNIRKKLNLDQSQNLYGFLMAI